MLNKRLSTFSNAITYEAQKKDVIDILKKNDYPMCVIRRGLDGQVRVADRNVQTTVNEMTMTVQNVDGDVRMMYGKIPYVSGLSLQISKILATDNLKIVYYHTFNVGRLYSNMKTSIPWDKQSSLVYELTCSCGASYTGQTRQHLGDRIRQHQVSLRKLREGSIQQNQQTGITLHITANPDHTIGFDEVKIKDRAFNFHKRLTKEAIHIYKTEDSMNLKSDIKEHVVTSVYSHNLDRLC